MNPIQIIAERDYKVTFTEDWYERLSEVLSGRRFIVITQQSLLKRISQRFTTGSVIVTPDGEAQKNLQTFTQIINQLPAHNLDRNSVIVGIGGGATTDFAGFLAATYLRGIDWIGVPTTVAGMVDASIGGKTGLNLEAGKNLVGSFHSPVEVIVDLSWLETLSSRDLTAGLAESLKCGFIKDLGLLDLFQDGYEKNLTEIIYRSIQVKADVVSSDFRETYEREVLNYGHTLGHAIEKHSDFNLRHGESIAIGMVFAAEIAHSLGTLSEDEVGLHYRLVADLGLPISYLKEVWASLLLHMANDKKRKTSAIRFVTLTGLGNPARTEIPDEVLKKIYLEKIGR
ncbi:MAG: 3-dehydroquinate synthase [Candidatus Nanopelagicaceae bacterium]